MNNIDSKIISELNPDGIVLINDLGKVKYVNTAFSDITGYSSRDLIGLDENILNTQLRDLCDADNNGEVFDINMTNNSTVMQMAKPVRRLIKCTLRIINNENKSDQGKILYFHDITPEQEKDGHIKSEFLSSASHKLRTPLVGILGFSELLLKQGLDPDKKNEISTIIFRQATNLKQAFDDFLYIEQLDAIKGKDFNLEKGTLEKVLNDVLSSSSHISEQIKIIVEAPSTWQEVKYDFDRMNQAITNLVSNAVKYSPDGGNVVCSTLVSSNNGSEEFGIRIHDQGIGITPSNLLHVGERFYRVDDLKSVSGSGLGIAIVKEIIAIHNGRFEITSTKGKGTTATVWLPVAAQT